MPFRSSSFARHRAAAFTLIELLAVILLIAILAALLYPAFGVILRKANQTASVNNLHQWYAGFTSAVQDNDGEMPTDGSAPFTATNDQAWYNRLPLALKIMPYSEFTIANRPTFGTKSIWVNPAVPAVDQKATTGYVFNYGFNDLLRDNSASNATSTTIAPIKMVRLQAPQATILMGEKADPSPNLNVGNVRSYFGGTDASTDLTGAANFLFCDGHVDLVKRSDFTSAKATDMSYLDQGTTNVSWYPFGHRDTSN